MKFETLKEAGYKFVCRLDNKEILLHNVDGNTYEIFFPNKNHASWGLRYKNTHLEYARTPAQKELNFYANQIERYEKKTRYKAPKLSDLSYFENVFSTHDSNIVFATL